MLGTDHEYDAFISYSHTEIDTAAALQRSMQRLARPWWKSRAMRVFRDESDLAAAPALWPTIERALEASQWLVLMASPRAAASGWVAREVAWWLEHRPEARERLLIVLTSGEIHWGDGDFDRDTTNALPKELFGVYPQPPTWVDLRNLMPEGPREPGDAALADVVSNGRLPDLMVAAVAAPIRGLSKSEMVGEHLRQRRTTRRVVTTTVAVLTVLTVLAGVTAWLAVDQSHEAGERARIAEARQLAAVSTTLLDDRLDLAQPMAVAAYRRDRNAETRAALLRSVLASPHLVRYLDAGDQVSALAGSADGRVIVAGTRGGDVLRWDVGTDPGTGSRVGKTKLAKLPDQVADVGISADGRVIAAAGRTAAVLWTAGRGDAPLAVPAGWLPKLITVSPGGARVAMTTERADAEYDEAPTLNLLDRATGAWHRSRTVRWPSRLSMPDEKEVVVFDGTAGNWTRHAVPAWKMRDPVGPGFGTYDFSSALSQGGRYFTYSNGNTEFQIWRTDATSASYDHPPLWGKAGVDYPSAMAVAPDGKRLAVAGPGGIHVSTSAARRGQNGKVTVLTGNESVNTDTLSFFGQGDDRLLSASGQMVTLWDLRQTSRIGSTHRLEIPLGCRACSAPRIAVRPDGRAVAVLDGNGETVAVKDLSSSTPPTVLRKELLDGVYGPPLWSARGDRLFLPTPRDGGGEVRGGGTAATTLATWPSRPELGETAEDDPVVMTGWAGRDGHLLEFRSSGRVVTRDAATGEVVNDRTGPPQLEDTTTIHVGEMDFDPTRQQAIIAANGSNSTDRTYALLLSTRDGRAERIPGDDEVGLVGFAGSRVLVQRTNGSLEVRSPNGRDLVRTIPGDGRYPALTTDNANLLVRLRSDGKAVVSDLGSSAAVGVVPVQEPPISGSIALRFSPDGSTLFVAIPSDGPSDQGALQQWSFDEKKWLRVACDAAGHDLTDDQWRRYTGIGAPAGSRCG
ncbi:TIR domain-containing protein [Actinomadura hibisca]|uniref:TIR domain-containing protein n=1 Tax=Actinomadura hibisca TaxID=68565 RepID=UPI0008330FB5|nr:toll/interleukin-1 receptor domain-containing protein [Actinomadura hibisca]